MPTKKSFLYFEYLSQSKSGLTEIHQVMTADCTTMLGTIYWFGAWRKYIFAPAIVSIYDPNCLREIADYVERLTKGHKGVRS